MNSQAHTFNSKMTSLFLCLILTFALVFSATVTLTAAARPSRTKALVAALHRDDSTLQRIIKINRGNPQVTIQVTVDLSGKLLWVDCDQGYKSYTYNGIHCSSARCNVANSKCRKTCKLPDKTGCGKSSCTLDLTNPFNSNAVTATATTGKLTSDEISINSTDGSNPIRLVSVPGFLFGCAHTSLLPGLAIGSKGIAGLGRTKLSLPSQFSSNFIFPNIFAVCASSSSFTDGFIIFGDKPYNLFPGLDVSTLLSYTPLIVNPAMPSEYFIGVKSIKIFQQEVPINKALLSINTKGIGGTKISTVKPYTIMQSSIYKAVTTAFVAQLERPGSFVKRVPAIAPFKVCYEAGSLPVTKIGVVVPDINLVMQSAQVVWTISGTNSMVRADDFRAYCLGIIDGGVNAKTAIVIGSYQLENNLLQFDLPRSRLGFSSSLLFSRTRCDNFNFTAA